MEWTKDLADTVLGLAVAGLVGVAKWVHTMAGKVEMHGEHIKKMSDHIDKMGAEHDDCMETCQTTRERIAVSEQDRRNLHEVVAEIKGDLKEILRHVRGGINGGR